MICTSIQNRNLEEIFALLDSGAVEMAEIRLDRCPLSEADIEALFSGTDVPLIATRRIAELASGRPGPLPSRRPRSVCWRPSVPVRRMPTLKSRPRR